MTHSNENELQKIRYLYSDLINYDSEDPTDPIDVIAYRDSSGDTLLHVAVLRNDYSTVLALLRLGMDPDLRGDMNRTPLHWATRLGFNAIAQLLLTHGAKSDLKDDFDEMPNV